LRLNYPTARIPDGAESAYWELLEGFTIEEIYEGVEMACRASIEFFPTAPAIAEQCAHVRRRRQNEVADARGLTSSADRIHLGKLTDEYAEAGLVELRAILTALDLPGGTRKLASGEPPTEVVKGRKG
jgi:hypothetical protein